MIDIPRAALGKGVATRNAPITGFVADRAVLAFTFAQYAGRDNLGRPLLEHDYVRIDLDAGVVTPAVSAPGYVVAATGYGLFTIEERWDPACATARMIWTAEAPQYPPRAHADPVNPGEYLLAMGYPGEGVDSHVGMQPVAAPVRRHIGAWQRVTTRSLRVLPRW